MSGKIALFALGAAVVLSVATAQDSPPAGPGILSDGNTYTNSTLGLQIKLPGSWQLQDRPSAHKAPPAGCTGPLCGDADINIALISAGDSAHRCRLFLSAWKLGPQYLNRARYPLKWFANIMLPGSLSQSSWVPLGDMTQVQLDGRSTYRLLVHDPGSNEPRGFGFVTESRGFMMLLVGSASGSSDEPMLQAAIEKLAFLKSAP